MSIIPVTDYDISLRSPRAARSQEVPESTQEQASGARSIASRGADSRRSLDFDDSAARGRAGKRRVGKENTLTLSPDGTLSKAEAKRLARILSHKPARKPAGSKLRGILKRPPTPIATRARGSART